MLDKFTEKALKAVIFSKQEAKKLSHSQIGTEHLLLGLMSEKTGIPARVLKAVGLTPEALEEKIAQIIPATGQEPSLSQISFSFQAIRALKIASDKAKSLGYIYVGPEHIFIALLGSEKFGSVKILNELGVDLARIKDTVTRITAKRSLNRAHPEIQASKKLTEITKAVQSKCWDIPFTVEDEMTSEMIEFAREELKAENTFVLGTEHILLAMLKSESAHLKMLLEEENLTYQAIKDHLNNNTDRSCEYDAVSYQLTPVAYRSLETAHEISADLGYGRVKPEHILLGILKENKGKALEILNALSVRPDSLYKKIVYPIEQRKPPTLSIIKLAKEEARRMEYNVVGTEHILLGLLCVGIGKAARVLNDLGVNLTDTRLEVERVIGYGSAIQTKEMTYTPRAKKLLEEAWREAREAGEPRIESEHLLLSIIRLKESMAMKVLTALGVDSIEIKQGIVSLIEESKTKEEDSTRQEDD